MWEKLLTSIIDIPHWDKAKWKAVLTIVSEDIAPAMGIFYEGDEASGRRIFSDWRSKFTDHDKDNLIRVTVVEGSIPGKAPGYSVYIGPDFDNITKLAKNDGEDLKGKVTLNVGRYQRMNPPPQSPNLARFKTAYSKFKHYAILPVFGPIQKPEPAFELAILKTQIQFRLAEELTDQDMELCVLH